MSFVLDDLATQSKRQRGSAIIRHEPADFCVDEILGFEPDGEGEHLWLLVKKQGLDSAAIANALARYARVRRNDVGFSGLKDNRAVTTQWFSVPFPAKQTFDFTMDGVTILRQQRHGRKLKRGTHKANAFKLLLRECDIDSLAERMAQIAEEGVPNYFGPQRFGRDGNNMALATAWLATKPSTWTPRGNHHLKGLILSAARSWLFNELLSERVADGSWLQPAVGDVMQFADSASIFLHDGSDPTALTRHGVGDCHITGPMWGGGELPSTGFTREREQAVAERYAGLSQGLVEKGLRQQRRALRLPVEELSFKACDDEQILVSFVLGTGSYATAVLRELIITNAA